MKKNHAASSLSALSKNQREAVVCDDKRILVLAGAGSGKTKTLLQKIIYLIEEKGAKPSEILAITFTKNATNEMIDRLIISADNGTQYQEFLSNKNINSERKELERYYQRKRFRWIDSLTIRTFHSFCYSALRNFGVNEFDNKFRVIGDEKVSEEHELAKNTAPETVFEVFHKLLIHQCEDVNYLLRLKRYVLDYLVDKIHLGRNDWYPSNYDNKFYTALDGTKVRSKSEQFIADWLYRHSIKYEYEPLLNVKDFPFRPDFYIPQANLYIEHVSNSSYPTGDKEVQFEKGGMLLVKTHERMTQDSALFNHTLDKIIKNRLPSGYHNTASLSYTEEFNGYHDQVKDFITQVMRITEMMKVENLDPARMLKQALKDQHERVRNIYELAVPITQNYQAYCVNKSYLDFNDLISRTITLFKNHPDIAGKFRNRYKYILVDEFQDVNNLQVELIKLMLTDETQLFCVGDDWQSIYGFRGSNVSYIINFENLFKDARVLMLNLNYRSTNHIVGASNEVISHNKFKIDKAIHASRKSEHKIVVYAGSTADENIEFCVEKVKELFSEGIPPDEIMFLYRRTKMYKPYFLRFRQEGIRVQGRTIHGAKGLESRVVFIIGLTDGSGGFPDIWLEDRIFQVIKKANYDLLMEEERRLFYVGITRAKEKLFLITEKGNESAFLKEIPEIFTVRSNVPLKSVVEEVSICEKCFSQLENLWIVCPYCGKKVSRKRRK
jgi:DNA helicase IV